MKQDFLAGARKKRLMYTPKGLMDAWFGLDASAKVYVGTIVGLIISVCTYHRVNFGYPLTRLVAACGRIVLWLKAIPRIVRFFRPSRRPTRMPPRR